MWAVCSICTAVGFVDVFFGLPTGKDVCRQKLVIFSFSVDTFVDKQEDTALALLLNLSDNYQKQAQTYTVVVQQ
jgi:hypothetical protein